MRLCEPLIIRFTDGTSLDLLPCDERLQIGYCTIPENVTDGLNHADYEIALLFSTSIDGEVFRGFEVRKLVRETYSLNNQFSTTDEYEYSISISGDTPIIISPQNGNIYEVSLEYRQKMHYMLPHFGVNSSYALSCAH